MSKEKEIKDLIYEAYINYTDASLYNLCDTIVSLEENEENLNLLDSILGENWEFSESIKDIVEIIIFSTSSFSGLKNRKSFIEKYRASKSE